MSKDAYTIISCNNQVEIILMNFGGKLQTILHAASLKRNSWVSWSSRKCQLFLMSLLQGDSETGSQMH